MVVKLVSVLLNFASNINTHQELCSGRTWERHSIAMCDTCVSWFQNKSRTNKITLCYLRNNSVDMLYTVNFIHYIAMTRMEIIFFPTSLNDITFYCFTLFSGTAGTNILLLLTKNIENFYALFCLMDCCSSQLCTSSSIFPQCKQALINWTLDSNATEVFQL